jgi:hypothetical protein
VTVAKRKREWTTDPETTKRINWAIREAADHMEAEPWAPVVLSQVAIEVGLSYIVHVLTQRQEEALWEWMDRCRSPH